MVRHHHLACPGCGTAFTRVDGHILNPEKRYFCSRLCRNADTLVERFWAKVQKSDGCWLWQGYRMASGYGTVAVNGREMLTHRFAYTLSHGEIPKGLHVCHHCDTPPCVRPDHLWLGTNRDNALDMVRKGRTPITAGPGELNRSARLTREAVEEIRRRHDAGGVTMTAIATEYGVSHTAIFDIVRRKSWRVA